MIRTYSELMSYKNFIDRYEYLRVFSVIGNETFGYSRYLNQLLYSSDKWRRTRRDVILRDNGCDLGFPGREILDHIIVHHMNPITKEDILNESEMVFNPEYLITVSRSTHEAIHYGNKSTLIVDPIERKPNDMCPWR